MKVLVVAEFYPRATDPVLGVWAHRQALAARAAGADVRVVVLHRPVPGVAAVKSGRVSRILAPLSQPAHAELDGLTVDYVKFLAPLRSRSYASWGARAAKPLRRALERIRAEFPFDLVHAHYAVPAADAVLRAGVTEPLVVSEHGGDIFHTAPGSEEGAENVRRAFGAARLILANSGGTAKRCEELGATETRVVHLGTDVPETAKSSPTGPVVSVGHLIPRKRNKDVLKALDILRDEHPELRYVIVGDGPERKDLEVLAGDLWLSERVEFRGQVSPHEARAAAWSGSVFVLPSIDEAFGVAYIEAMAGGVPAIGSQWEMGPEEIAGLGPGMRLVPPGNPEELARAISAIISDAETHARMSRAARETVEAQFTWEACGRATVAAYEEALAARVP